ncbi:MAG TPA: hypothetical protein VLX61_07300 [Anaerolineales bacterium]|nr:hypothetical protein [Anaerolineales bacterium]
MQPRIPEKDKRPNVCYAITDDGLELPVIDVTNPVFQISLNADELDAQLHQFIRDAQGPEKVPPFLRGLLFAFMRRQSVLMRGLMGSDGTFLSGMNTYMIKLGADNLNKSYFSAIDRTIAGSPAGLFMRLRLQDIAHLLSEALIPILDLRPSAALHLLNIGGGSAIDSLNALIVIYKRRADLIDGRPIFIHVMDLNTVGPNFGARALASLQSKSGPLQGADIGFEHIPYNWSHSTALRDFLKSLPRQSIIAASSEGALFEYGSDDEITGNLQALFEAAPADTVVAGSVTRGDELGLQLNGHGLGSRAALQMRGLEAFTALANRAGWQIAKSVDRPLSHDVLMKNR